MSILDEYKAEINKNLRDLKGEVIATVHGKKIILEETNNHGHLTIKIENKKIKFITRITESNGDVRLIIFFNTKNKGGSRNTCLLGEINAQDEIKLLNLIWAPRRIHPADHYKYWWKKGESDNPRAEISLNRNLISINLIGKTIEIKFTQEIFTLNGEYRKIDDWGRYNLFKLQANSIALRCVDWLLYNVRENTEIDIDVDEKSITTSIGNIFNENINDIKTANEYTDESKLIEPLTPYTLKKNCETQGLFYSHDVYQIIANSMNLGRHLILTGSPGCGKSRLAELVGTMVNGNPPKIVTASPSWTSGEIVGRYFPRYGDGKLRFHPGVFLQALEENCCLVIDEINRANLDECMGELFTVLAGQSVDLPYMDTIDDYEESIDSKDNFNNQKIGYVKIIPTEAKKKDFPDHATYLMNDGFRLIGTMNDSDRSALHNLSFALLRRFDVVKITAPSTEEIEAVANRTIKKRSHEIFLKFSNIDFKNSFDKITSSLIHTTKIVFIEKNGLIDNNVCGISTMIDVLNFCLESLVAKNYGNLEIKIDNENKIPQLTQSIFSLGLIIKVLPQLDALDDEEFKNTIEKIKNGLNENFSKDENPVKYQYIDKDNDGFFVRETEETISKNFFNKVKTYYHGSIRESIIKY